MSSILCRCDNVIWFVECPSKVWHCAYPKSVVSAFLEADPQYRLSKLYYDYDWDYYFWRCEYCGRMYKFPDKGGGWKKVFSISRELPTISWDEIQKLPEFYLFSDVQLAEPLENNEELALSEFLAYPPHPYRFFVSEDESVVYVYNNVTECLEFVYKDETITSDEEVAKRTTDERLHKHKEDSIGYQFVSPKLQKIYGNRPLIDMLAEAPNVYFRLIKGSRLVGSLNVPQLSPVNISVDTLESYANSSVPFRSTKYCANPSEYFFHFYEDDDSFEQFWNNPEKYLDVLAKYKFGVSTDFSMYLSLSRREQQFNLWRNRATAYYLQQRLPFVIPNACWGDFESLNWAFDGLPEESVLAVTSQGCMQTVDVCMQVFVNGLHQLIREKRPTALLVYGKFPEEWRERFPVPIIRCKTFAETRLKTLANRFGS